jgi:hypothetical protein
VVVGVGEEDLDGAVGAEFGVVEEWDAAGFEAGGGFVGVVDGEGDMVVS